MNDMMLQATRLTRESRLIEATALIQRMLRGENDCEIARLGDKPPTIDGPHYFQTLRDPIYRFKYPSRHGPPGWMGPAPFPRRTLCQQAGNSLYQLRGKPRLQAVHPQPISGPSGALGRHAARGHSNA